jgi:hypothetical protein
MPSDPQTTLEQLQSQWSAAWPDALAAWSRFVQLSAPVWCLTQPEEEKQGLTGSFAMIRLSDHTVVISLRQVQALNLGRFALEILAHEIGHHVYCPADLTDNARALARIRRGLPTKEHLAPMVSNLYTDLLINDRLQRTCSLPMSAVYQTLDDGKPDKSAQSNTLWTFYMRIYEVLWSLPRATLAKAPYDESLNQDAVLGARLIRSYARDWVAGAGRFACLCLTYLLDDAEKSHAFSLVWHDTKNAGVNGFPEGMVDIDPDEEAQILHPSDDPELSGLPQTPRTPPPKDALTGLKTIKGKRQPFEYLDVIKASGVTLSDDKIIARYYRDLALPHLVNFPVRQTPPATDPYPEGLDTWDIGTPLNQLDWLGTLTASPIVIPGVTTRLRLQGDSPGSNPDPDPIDLYLGVDCSGSMGNPANSLSLPILAGAIIALSALRAGARVMVALSGEPGGTITTDGFTRDQWAVLGILTSYLGTGYTFGIHRLDETFTHRPLSARPVHILIVTDNDLFNILDVAIKARLGWDAAQDALKSARGGGTVVIQLPAYLLNDPKAADHIHPGCHRLTQQGWSVANVDSMDQLIIFAKAFSKHAYNPGGRK